MDNHEINIDSGIWGPHAWFLLDTIALAYPRQPTSEQMIQYKNFFSALQFVLPCAACRYHYKQYIQQNPLNDIVMSDKAKLISWLLRCHNQVRERQHKSQISLSDFYNFYNKNCCINLQPALETTVPSVTPNAQSDTSSWWLIVIVGLVGIAVVLFLGFKFITV